jgi:hypothetical protein
MTDLPDDIEEVIPSARLTRGAVREVTRAVTNGQVDPSGKETVRIENITPARAKKWLEGNVDNRKLRDSRVLHLSKILQLGEWDLTGDAIVFDSEGVLINGQHRLTAIVVTGIPARMVVLRGVPSKAQEVMDQGLSRNLADQLHRRGIPYTHIIAGALNWLYQMKYIEETGNVHYADPSMRPSLRELLQLFDQNLDLVEEAPTIGKLVYYTKVRPGPTLAIKHRLRLIDVEDAELFFQKWQEGTDLERNDPVWRLREWTLNDARTRTTSGRAPSYRYVAYVLKAWNLWREGLPTLRLNWVFSPSKREAWPTPR